MSLAKQEFTDVGKSMLGRAQNTEILRISKLVVGSGAAGTPAELWPLTALKTHEMDVTISTRRDYGNGVMLVEGSFRSDDAPHAFLIRELGVMAHIGAEADRLYSVANVFADPPDNVDPASPSVHTFKVKLIIDRIPTGQLDVSIGPTEAVMGENIGADTVGAGAYKEAVGNVLRFKRLVEGSGMEIRDEVDTIYIGVSTLQVDLDLYVPASHPNCPSPDVGFPTVQEAHDHLLQWIIPASRLARINVYQGTFKHQGTTFSHPNAKQIQLLGWPRQDKAVTAINWTSATTKDVFCNNTGMAAGMIVYLTNCASGWAGGCRIGGVFAGLVRCDVPNRSSRPVYSTNDAGAGRRMSWFPTIIDCDNPSPNVSNLSFPNGINLVQNITALNGWAGFGLTGSCRVSNCMAIDCLWGFNVGDGRTVFGGDIVATNCDGGLASTGIVHGHNDGTIWHLNGCTTGAGSTDALAILGAANAPQSNRNVYINHCVYGINAYGAANVRAGAVQYSINDIGMYSQKGGIILIGPIAATPLSNGTDLYAQGASYIEYGRVGGPVPTCNPAAETIGNQNSLIHVIP